MTENNEPTLTPHIHHEPEEFLGLAALKWIKFNTSMWHVINDDLEVKIKRSTIVAWLFRIAIIVLSAAITTMSDIEAIARVIVTITAGVLTALTGIEAFFQFGNRHAEMRRQQREIEALRDKLRFEWFRTVEIGDDVDMRLGNAKRLLEEGPAAYNEILNKYALKAEKGDTPGEVAA